MARIRSIKPEFAVDGDMLRLSDSCALFFILLWNFCDDEGKHRLDYDQAKAELGGRWDKGKLRLFVTQLVKSGQLVISSDSAWLRVTGWSHQKIDKPKQPDVKAADIQWLNQSDSTNALDESRTINARIGSDRRDRIGSDHFPPGAPAPTEPDRQPALLSESKTVKPKAETAETWAAYSVAYERRHGVPPVRNASVNAKLAQFVKRVGAEEAPQIAAFFVGHNDAYYVKRGHPVGFLLADAEKLRTEWFTGRQITGTDAKHAESAQHYRGQMERIARGEI